MWQAQRAREFLAAGSLLLEQGKVNAAATRLYYAMYQACWHVLARANALTIVWDPVDQKVVHRQLANNTNLVYLKYKELNPRDNSVDKYALRDTLSEIAGQRVEADYRAGGALRETLADIESDVAHLVRRLTA